MEGRGEEERECGSGEIVELAVGVEESVLGFVEHGVGGVHQQRVGDGEGGQGPAVCKSGGGEEGEKDYHLDGGDDEVEAGGKWEIGFHGRLEEDF